MVSTASSRSSDLSLSAKSFSPVLRAWSLGLLSTTTPTIFGILLATARGKLSSHDASAKIRRVLQSQVQPDRFAALCAYLLAGATLLPRPFLFILRQQARSIPQLASVHDRLSLLVRFVCVFVSAWASFRLLNRRPAAEIEFPKQRTRRVSNVTFAPAGALPHPQPPPRPKLAGRTLDLTFFGTVRALDICVSAAWSRWRARSGKTQASTATSYAAPALFTASSALVMWNWFYLPERLPRSYNRWISAAAQTDSRLIEALRQLRYGNFVYGVDTGMADLLGGMCRDLGMPEVWGDPAKTIPIRCEVVHGGSYSSCEMHAMSRFARAWRFAMRMYLPINLLVLLRRPRAQRNLGMAVLEASQSSAFLGMFVALFYYGVCLTRTRIGPKLLQGKKLGPMDFDGGMGVGMGCLMCGWSILLEKAARRQEIGFFVAPRALATLFPRRYEQQHMWREQLAFASSAAVIITAAQADPSRVRGVFGRLLGGLLS